MVDKVKAKLQALNERLGTFADSDAPLSKVMKVGAASAVFFLFVFIAFQLANGAYFLISKNWEMFLGGVLVVACIANYLFGKKPKQKAVIADSSLLEYNYKMFRKPLYHIVTGIAAAFSAVPPKIPSDLDAPVRWTFLGATPVYHYVLQVVDEVDTELLKSTLQVKINQRLESGSIDGKEASSKIFGSMAYPRIMVHEVEAASNFAEISVVFTTEEYVELLRDKHVGGYDDSLDIRILEDEDI